eukprot:7002245-Heterocapsa_arctica.AAC.1
MPWIRANALGCERSCVDTTGALGGFLPGMPMLACRFADWSLAGHQRGSVWPSPVATATTL